MTRNVEHMRMLVKRAKSKWGTAWQMLSEDARDAAVCQEIVGMLTSQCDAPEGSALKHLIDIALAARLAVEPKVSP